ncbi:MAG TPA: hypothetical protein VG651_16140 [Stellaceae bacterium]|nr:hypothetical protein [Stellaceae bacterium]
MLEDIDDFFSRVPFEIGNRTFPLSNELRGMSLSLPLIARGAARMDAMYMQIRQTIFKNPNRGSKTNAADILTK